MATEKKITPRIQQKHDVAANWAKATNFIPKKGEIIIYEAEYNASGEETQAVRFKIGDGSKTVGALPFAVIDYSSDIETLEQEVADNSTAIGTLQGAFESDGTTVKKATSAETADKVVNGLTLGGGVVYDGSKAVSISSGDHVSITGGPNGISIGLGFSVMPSTYNKVTVDGYGIVTGGENVDYAKKTDLATVATSGSYNDLSNKPTIPAAANNGTLTIQKNGTNVATFGANQSTDATANITVPTKVSEITNDSGFITSDGSVKSVIDYNDTSKKIKVGYAGTGISGDGIKYIAGYTAGDSESEAKIKDISKDALKSWLGYAAVATSGSYNDLSDKPSFDELTRIQKQAYTGGDNTVKYFKLASFPVYNSGGNYASFIITGRMGGWQADNMSFVNMILYNRNGEGGGYINVANSAFFNLCDIVMYREADGTSTAYLKVKSYYTFDINVNTYQATNVYTGTDDTPTGTLKWTASEQADRLAVSGGVAYVNGFTLPKQVEINGETVNPNSAGLINLGTGFAKAADLPIKSATLTGTTLYLTL